MEERGFGSVESYKDAIANGIEIARQQSLVLLVGAFEVFINDILRQILLAQIDRLLTKNRVITYRDILPCESLEQLHNRIVDKEVAALDKWYKKRKYFEEEMGIFWDESGVPELEFEKIIRTRNDIIHNRGKVDYNLQKIYVKLDPKSQSPKIGDNLSLSSEDVRRASDNLSKIAAFLNDIIMSKISGLRGEIPPQTSA